jgi:hypothetical protein
MCRWSSLTFRYARCSAASPRERAAIQPLTCRVTWRFEDEAAHQGAHEGVAVVHVITKPSGNPEYAETDVMLSRYNGGTPLECIYLTGSITECDAALEMHTHW